MSHENEKPAEQHASMGDTGPIPAWVEEAVARTRAMDAGASAPIVAPFQNRVDEWLIACFGEEIARDKVERNHRFLEESLELVQALGCTASEAHQLVDYTFGRPVGEPSQECGGVVVTLAALCIANGLWMDGCAEVELTRIHGKIDQIRAKQAVKPKHSPLPAPIAAQECACRKALEQIKSIPKTNPWLWGGEAADYMMDITKAALATPCPREPKTWSDYAGTDAGRMDYALSEIAQLKADLAEALRTRDEQASVDAKRINDNAEVAMLEHERAETLAADLKEAVKALEPFKRWIESQDDPRGMAHFVRYADPLAVVYDEYCEITFGEFRHAAAIVAKHQEPQP